MVPRVTPYLVHLIYYCGTNLGGIIRNGKGLFMYTPMLRTVPLRLVYIYILNIPIIAESRARCTHTPKHTHTAESKSMYSSRFTHQVRRTVSYMYIIRYLVPGT